MRKSLRILLFYKGLFFLILWLPPGLLSAGTEGEGADIQTLDRIRSWFENFEEYLGRTSLIGPGEEKSLPLGIRTSLGSTNYDMIVTQAVFGPQNTEVAVYLRISGPDWQGKERCLYFGADKVLISSRGGFVGDVKLALMGSVQLSGKGNGFRIHLLGEEDKGAHPSVEDHLPPTYAIVNCEGFKELQVSAVLELDHQVLAPVENGKLSDKPLKVAFYTVASSLDDILVEISLPEFALRSVPDWKFASEKTIFDFSMSRNAEGFSKIKGLDGRDEIDGVWQGIYLERLKMSFPDYVKKVDGSNPSVELKDFWIDEGGFSGEFILSDVLRLDQGSISGWGFSVDRIEMDFSGNRLVKGGMEGKIELPVTKAGNYGYQAGFQEDGSWNMLLSLDKPVEFEFLEGREVELFRSSYLKGERQADTSFLLEANLSGRMKMNPLAQENDRFGYGNFEFIDMKIRSHPPYMEIGRIEWDDELKYGNFPVSIKDIEVSVQEKDLSLAFRTLVHLGNESDGGFAGELGMAVRSRLETGTGKHRWVYEGVEVSDVEVDFSNAYLNFKGKVSALRNHKVYGNAFQGSLDIGIVPLNLGIRGDAMMGSMPSYRYWFVDLLARLGGSGIPVFPGFQISAIGGGAYRGMRLDPKDDPSESFGKTASGLRYVPDSTAGLGVKASLILSATEPKLFSSELGFEMLFNRNGGLSDIYMKGTAQMMNHESGALERFNQRVLQLAAQTQPSLETQRRAVASEASVSAEALFQMDVNNKVFVGNLDAYMDLGFIKGKGSGGRLGKMSMRFGDENWYVKIGEPSAPLGVKMQVGALSAGLDAYFMTGQNLPPFPGIPSELAYLFGDTDYRQPDMDDLRRGAGFAFGSKFNLETGNLDLSIFYARFNAQIGFDIMMKQYLNTICAETGTFPGCNHWYAQGQAYAYMLADIGMKFNMLGKDMRFSVLKGEVGSLLQAALPNPSSLSGRLGLNVSILNGLVKGRFNLGFDLGESCTLQSQGFAEGKSVIADMKPSQTHEKTDVFSIPQTAFNLPIEVPFSTDYDNQEKKIRLELKTFELWHGGTRLDGNLEWDEDQQLVSFVSHDVLPSEATIDYKVEVKAKESTGKSWKVLKTDQGEDFREYRHYTFVTGKGPDSIPWSNVKFTYPVRGQRYFLPGEFKKGFVFLERGMDYLLASPDYKKRLYAISPTDTLSAAFTYNQAERRLAWYMPEGLMPETLYTLQFVLEGKDSPPVMVSGSDGGGMEVEGVSAQGNTGVDRSQTLIYSEESGSLSQETVRLSSVLEKTERKVILEYDFSTSRYRTFGEKLAGTRILSTYRTPVLIYDSEGNVVVESPDVHYLQAGMQTTEPFDSVEIHGSRWSSGRSLIEAEADLGNEPYYLQDIYPLIYKEYPYGGSVNFERQPGNSSLVPSWAVYPSMFYSESEPDNGHFPWIYYLPVQYRIDYDQIMRGVAEEGLFGNPYYLTWLNKPFIKIPKGNYPVFLKYRLPDGTQTSLRRVVFENQAD